MATRTYNFTVEPSGGGGPECGSGPYSCSTYITNVSFDFANKITGASGSDNFPFAWAADGNVYTVWGDGGGFYGTNTQCRSSFGLAKIVGTPPSLSYQNITGCRADDSGCSGSYTHDSSCDATYADTVGGPGGSLTSVNSILWAVSWQDTGGDGTARLSSSSNYGQTWNTEGNWPISSGNFVPTGWVQFGQNNAGARDSYVYLMGRLYGDVNNIFLARATPATMDNTAAYEYYTSSDPGSPTWGAWGSRQPIHTDANKTGSDGGDARMQYFAPLSRYILTQHINGVEQWSIYEAEEPWGPWYTVLYDTSVSGVTATGGTYLNLNISPKWISADGKEFWMDWSGSNGYDNFNLVKGTFEVTPSPTLAITTSSRTGGTVGESYSAYPDGERLPAAAQRGEGGGGSAGMIHTPPNRTADRRGVSPWRRQRKKKLPIGR